MQPQWLRVGKQVINLNQVMKFEISELDKDTVYVCYVATTAANGDSWSELFCGHEGRDLIAWLERDAQYVDVCGWSTLPTDA